MTVFRRPDERVRHDVHGVLRQARRRKKLPGKLGRGVTHTLVIELSRQTLSLARHSPQTTPFPDQEIKNSEYAVDIARRAVASVVGLAEQTRCRIQQILRKAIYSHSGLRRISCSATVLKWI